MVLDRNKPPLALLGEREGDGEENQHEQLELDDCREVSWQAAATLMSEIRVLLRGIDLTTNGAADLQLAPSGAAEGCVLILVCAWLTLRFTSRFTYNVLVLRLRHAHRRAKIAPAR